MLAWRRATPPTSPWTTSRSSIGPSGAEVYSLAAGLRPSPRTTHRPPAMMRGKLGRVTQRYRSPSPSSIRTWSGPPSFSSGDRIRTCDLWVMSYAPGIFGCSCGLKFVGHRVSGVRLVASCRTDLERFRGVWFPNLFPDLAGTKLIDGKRTPRCLPRVIVAPSGSRVPSRSNQRIAANRAKQPVSSVLRQEVPDPALC
jgi:hypothetical protein